MNGKPKVVTIDAQMLLNALKSAALFLGPQRRPGLDIAIEIVEDLASDWTFVDGTWLFTNPGTPPDSVAALPAGRAGTSNPVLGGTPPGQLSHTTEAVNG